MPYKTIEQRRNYARAYKHKHKEKFYLVDKAYATKNLAEGNCTCGRERDNGFYHCVRCRETRVQSKNKTMAKKRERVLDHYGNICGCCGETNSYFLCVDHVNNDGNIHRREVLKGTSIYHWLIKMDFPEGFQLLCYNCNFGKRVNQGTCPHENALE